MSVTITFEPSGISGMVATGTYLIDAARRLGAPVGAGCLRGRAACPACMIKITSGSDLISTMGNLERSLLSQTQIDDSLRLACQVKLEGDGDVVVRVVRIEESAKTSTNPDLNLKKEFSTLPLEKKIATLMQLEAITVSEAFNAAIEKPLALGSKALDRLTNRGRTATSAKDKKK